MTRRARDAIVPKHLNVIGGAVQTVPAAESFDDKQVSVHEWNVRCMVWTNGSRPRRAQRQRAFARER
jgi:hypothetical protein